MTPDLDALAQCSYCEGYHEPDALGEKDTGYPICPSCAASYRLGKRLASAERVVEAARKLRRNSDSVGDWVGHWLDLQDEIQRHDAEAKAKG